MNTVVKTNGNGHHGNGKVTAQKKTVATVKETEFAALKAETVQLQKQKEEA